MVVNAPRAPASLGHGRGDANGRPKRREKRHGVGCATLYTAFTNMRRDAPSNSSARRSCYSDRRDLEPPNGSPMMRHMFRQRPARQLSRVLRPHVLGLLLLGQVACAMSPDRLPPPDRQFYYNLPTAEDRTKFLKLDETERQPFLQQKGLWARWMELSPEEREAAKRGEVKAGYKEFTAFMAWGPPADSQASKTDSRAVRFHTFIRCTSGPKAGRFVASNLECDGTSSEVEIAVENGVITEVKFLN